MTSAGKVTIILIALILSLGMSSYGQDISHYLIANDIGVFAVSGDPSSEDGPGVLDGGDHFFQDHRDVTYEIDYYNSATKVGPDVQVTQHAGSDSDKWLLHEVERSFQQRDALGAAYAGKNPIRDINGNRIFYMWRLYRWISNNVVVSIEASEPQGAKPEPMEVVQAYLQKYPSTIPATLVLDDAHKIQWIKDEMDRRLWLCDKWFMQLQLKKAEEKDVYREAVKSMNIFLDYREKYFPSFFSSFKAAPEKNVLEQLLAQSNGTGIRSKLKEYKDWWAGNKDKSISL